MTRVGFVTAIVATLLIATTGLCVYYQLNSQDSTPKTAVVREALRVCTQDLGSLRYSMLTQGGAIIILSNDQIEDVVMPRALGELEIVVLSQATIDSKAAVDGPFLYLVFDEVNVYDTTAFVSFYVTGVFDSGAGGSISLTLRNGAWVGEGGLWWIA